MNAANRFGLLLGMQVLSTLLLGGAILYFGQKGPSPELRDREYLREVGTRLLGSGVLPPAIKSYEEYLQESSLDEKAKSKIAFSLGEMYESGGNFEEALRYFYLVEIFDPSGKDYQQTEAKKRVVALLEKLKKFSAAQGALDEAVLLGGPTPKKGGEVIAKVGQRELYLHDLNEALDDLPPPLRQNFQSAEGKRNFLKKFVADAVLLEKAKKLGYQDNAQIRQNLERIKNQLMVQKVLQEEVLNKIQVDDQDVKNFYEAHKNEYKAGDKVPPFDKIKTQVSSDYRRFKEEGQYQKLLEETLKTQDVQLFMEKLK